MKRRKPAVPEQGIHVPLVKAQIDIIPEVARKVVYFHPGFNIGG